MSPRQRRSGRVILALIGCFYAGIAVGWLLRASFTRDPLETPPVAAPPTPSEPPERAGAAAREAVLELRRRVLRVPLDGAEIENMKGGFLERRDAGERAHHAVDMLAPRNTPVHAVDDGTVAKLLESRDGGTTIYQFDPEGRFCYYYAHLERYEKGLKEGQAIAKGQIIGYVGTTGNAPRNTPHLHFAIFELTAERQWWEGAPVDPYDIFSRDRR
jgi:murein DD-endopeptidase MepM/ murein hydrolase activator NlpD